MDYQKQIERIKEKLKQAREKDSSFKAFGASSHRYQIESPIDERVVREFEEQYEIKLPDCYRAFLLGVGNGGSSESGSGAGPFYGIYPLGAGVEDIVDEPEITLKNPVVITPQMNDDVWVGLAGRLLDDEDISDDEYDLLQQKLFGGILPIGSQGCTYIHGLLLHGKYAGKVVNMSMDIQKPKFTYEDNFLDWYERWLDEVISGSLLNDSPDWFGYTKGGSATQLMHDIRDATNDEDKVEALVALMKWDIVSVEDSEFLFDLTQKNPAEVRYLALQALAKFDYERVRDELINQIAEKDIDCLNACKCLFWYAKDASNDWLQPLKKRLPSVDDPELFSFACYLLEASKSNYSKDLEPFCSHSNEQIRRHAFYTLGNLPSKNTLVSLFKMGLNDDSPIVVHSTLQALEGVKDPSLMEEYQKLQIRFKTNEHYILSNLKHRLDEMRGTKPAIVEPSKIVKPRFKSWWKRFKFWSSD